MQRNGWAEGWAVCEVYKVWADGKTKGFIEPKGSRRRVRVRVLEFAREREGVRV